MCPVQSMHVQCSWEESNRRQSHVDKACDGGTVTLDAHVQHRRTPLYGCGKSRALMRIQPCLALGPKNFCAWR